MKSSDTKRVLSKNSLNSPTDPLPTFCEVAPSKKNAKTNSLSFYEPFGFLVNASSIGLIITDTKGSIISFNKTIQELLGISIEEYRHKNVADLYADPDNRQYLLKMLSVSKTIRDFEVNLKHKDGSLRTVLANIDSIDFNNRPVLLTSLYDITQYKQRQTNENETDKNYHTLFSDVPVGITVTDFQGNLIVSNNAIKELLGYDADELEDLRVLDFYLIPSDRKQLISLTKKLGNVRDFETVFRHKNGSQIPVLINTDTIEFNEQKNMLLTSIRDISNLKQIEDELVKERDFSNAILHTAATLIVVLDCKGAITRFNRTCEQLTGYSFDEIAGKQLWETGLLDPSISREIINQLIFGKNFNESEVVLICKNGEKYLISWTFAPMYNQDHHIEYIIATGIDITKRQQAEDALQKANQQLASWVQELQKRTEEMNLLNELGEQLQICQTVAEACTISTQYLKQLYPTSHGALYLLNESKDLEEAVEMWGEPPFTQMNFPPLDCWAIRRGQQHLVDAHHPGLFCQHFTGIKTDRSLCIPLVANGESIGILHLNHIDPLDLNLEKIKNDSQAEHQVQIITTVAEHIALALSNLKLKETLRQQSIRDILTGLFNRRYMEETLARELRRAERENKPIGIIMFDIDHFKAFNDLVGHDGGDALLRELGQYLNKNTRGGDIVCRYGGEEFLIVLPNTDIASSSQYAEKLRQGVKKLSVHHMGTLLAKCTISLGVAAFPVNGTTSEMLLKAVDNALYRAKNEGRDCVVQSYQTQ